MSSGGSFEGYISAAERALTLGGEGTGFIPGHGPVGGQGFMKPEKFVEIVAQSLR